MSYDEALDWLFSTQTFGIKLGLDGPRRLLAEALAFPPASTRVIHVAGTNGKGSVCAMIDSIARACGRRSGLFTSPHLCDFRERIRVNGEMIPRDECAARLAVLRRICAGLDPHPTFFEITLALAMQWFRATECEFLVLETGMGGRLDATTAVPADVCVITPVGMDHMQWLGGTLEEIAAEKAGIIVPGKPLVCSPQDPAAAFVIEKEANRRRAPLEFVSEPLHGYHCALTGVHQSWNAAVAVAALHKAGIALRVESVRQGLAEVSWPGRFERLRPGLVLDGAHNAHSAATLARTWREEFPGRKAALVFGAAADKALPDILRELCPIAGSFHFCPINNPRSASPAALPSLLPGDAPPASVWGTFGEACAAAAASGDPVLVTGSLFLVGEARAFLTDCDFRSSAQ
jgi:dihydrofolate synthase/folylpolyglutamate synthase